MYNNATGGKTIATVVSSKHAYSAENVGADTLLVTGHEAAAHGGDVSCMCVRESEREKVCV